MTEANKLIKTEEVYRDDLAVVENVTFDPPLTKSTIRRMKEQLMGSEIKYDLIREDGRLERMCKHGIGHTVGHLIRRELKEDYIWVHGCDGCCREYARMK